MSAEFNPWVAAMCELELVSHWRLYRLLNGLCEHIGVSLPAELSDHPDLVDRQPFASGLATTQAT